MFYKRSFLGVLFLWLVVFGIFRLSSNEIKIEVLDTSIYNIEDTNSYAFKSIWTQVTRIKVEDKKYDIGFDYNIYRNDLENKSYKSVLESEIKRMDYKTPDRTYKDMLYIWQWWRMIKIADIESSWDIEDTIWSYVDSIFINDCKLVKVDSDRYFTWSWYETYSYDLSGYDFNDEIEFCPYLYQNQIPWFVYDKDSPDKLLIAVIQDGIGWWWDESWIKTMKW